MFTGLIEEIGKIKNIQISGNKKKFEISAHRVLEDLQIDHSIAIEGVCLTATAIGSSTFWADAVEETLNRTTLKFLQINDSVNLERALRLSDRLGGHIVQGHVDGMGRIVNIEHSSGQTTLSIEIPTELERYTIPKGSIAIDGVSLTIAEKQKNEIKIAVIPHTWQNTTFQFKKPGDLVNIEVDFFAKYIEQFLLQSSKTTITENWLKQQGFD